MGQLGLRLQVRLFGFNIRRTTKASVTIDHSVFPSVVIRVHPWLICLFIYAHLCSSVTGRAGNGGVVRYHSPGWVELPVVEPWPEAADGKELLDGLMRELERFVVFSKWAAVTFALWILHTYAFRLRDVTTYIGIESPEKECA